MRMNKVSADRFFRFTGVLGILCLSAMASRDQKQRDVFSPEKKDTVSMQEARKSKNAATKKQDADLTSAITHLDTMEQIVKKSEEKRKQVINVVNKGVDALQKNTLADAFNKIMRSSEYKYGDLYLSIMDSDFTELVGYDVKTIWEDMRDVQDDFGIYLYRQSAEAALKGDGWYVYTRRHVAKIAYARAVEKEGKTYFVRSGYYPISKAEVAIGLIKAAGDAFSQAIAKGRKPEVVWGLLGYSLGKYVVGDLYVYVINEQGDILSDGKNAEKIGTNALNEQDAHGVYFNQEIINQLKDKKVGQGIWVDAILQGALKKFYAERVVDTKGNNYFVVTGFYPSANSSMVVKLVKKGAAILTAWGAKKIEKTERSIRDIHELQNLRYGPLSICIYDAKGICVSAVDKEIIGTNQNEVRDGDGRFIVKEIIQKAQKEGSGWLGFITKNAFSNIYLERVVIGKDLYVVCCEMYPLTEREAMMLLVKSAAEYFKSHTRYAAFDDFGKGELRFVRGGLSVFVLDTKGVCYAWGENDDRIWRNLYAETDEEGRPYIKMMINITKNGPGTFYTRELNARKFYYVEPVIKDNKVYIIGSGCFS
jgi:hypothetical protein